MGTFDLTTGRELDPASPESLNQGGAEQKPKSVLLSEQVFQAYSGGQRKRWATQALKDDKFRNGVQWTKAQETELEEKDMSAIVVNVVHPNVEQLKAALTSNKPRFTSTGREGSDLRVGAAFSDILTWVWDVSLGNIELKQAIDDYTVRSMGVFVVYQDPNADNGKGEVIFKSLNPLDVYFDPNAKDIFCRDSAHIVISKIYTGEQIQRMYPAALSLLRKATPIGGNPDQPTTAETTGDEDQIVEEPVEDIFHQHYHCLDRYSRVKASKFHCYDPQSGMEKVLSAQEYVAFLQQPAYLELSSGGTKFITSDAEVRATTQLYQATQGVYHYVLNPQDPNAVPRRVPGPENAQLDAVSGMQTIPQSTVRLEQLTMRNMVEYGIVVVDRILVDRIQRVLSFGGVLFFEGELPVSQYPIVPMMNRWNRNPYPLSDVRFVRPLQVWVNKLRSLIIAHATNSTSVKYFMPRGAANRTEIETELKKAGTAVIEYDAELGGVTVGGPVPLPNELYKLEADTRKDIQEIFGIYTLSQGDPNSAPSTYKGTVALDDYAQRRIKSKKDDIEETVNQLARVIVEYIQATYTEPKVMRIIRPNNKPLDVAVNQPVYDDISGELVGRLNDITVGQYDVVMVSGSTLPVNRWARFEYYAELYKMGIIDQQEVLKQTEVVDMEGVLKRMSEINVLRQQLAQAMEEIKRLSGDLQTAQRESVHAQQKLEVHKFKNDLDLLSAKASGATDAYEQALEMDRKVQNAQRKVAAPKKGKS